MRVIIESEDVVIWYRDAKQHEGTVSLNFVKDGTQQKIITALEEAIFQAKNQMYLSDNID